MSLTLTSNPVVDNENLFAGFLPVVFSFKREDEVVVSIGSGANTNILITTTNDLSSIISAGDYVYLYNVGDNGHIYNLTAEVLDISGYEITIDSKYIELGTGGYINYKKNYYVELDLVNPENDDIKILPFNLRDDGKPNGEVNIDVSIVNDLNEQYYLDDSGLLENSRTIFKVRYREVSDVETTSYIKIDDEIILTYATEQFDLEDFIYSLEEGEMYIGYEFGICFAHTKAQNEAGITQIEISLTELDENKETIKSGILLYEIDATQTGIFYIKMPDDYAFDENTEYITFTSNPKVAAFFDDNFFDNNFFDA